LIVSGLLGLGSALLAFSPAVAQDNPPAAGGAQAQGEAHHGKSADQVARELTNPNNDLAKLTFKNRYTWYKGDLPGADDQDNYTLLFQPIFPFTLGPTKSGGKSVLFVRPAIPFVVDQPVPKASGDSLDWDGATALGDIGYDVMYGVTEKSGLIWALGVAGTFPTATDGDVGGKQWRLGPEFIVAKISKWGVVGAFPTHQWDVTGWGKGEDNNFSVTSTQFFLTHTPGGGWAIGTQPTIAYDWESEEWTVPLHLTVSRTIIANGRPWKFEFEANYYVDQPDAFGPEWMVGFNITPVVNNFISNMIRGK